MSEDTSHPGDVPGIASRGFPAPILDEGNSLIEELAAKCASLETFTPSAQIQLPVQVTELEKLADSIGEDPIARQFRGQAQQARDAYAERLESVAREAFREYKNTLALDYVKRALEFAPGAAVTERLEKAAQELGGYTLGSPWKGIRPIKNPPKVMSTRVIGTRLWVTRRFPEDPDLDLANLYLSFFGIPTLPLGRYVVRRHDEGWAFYGIAPWTPWMIAHLLIATSAICIYFLFFTK